MNKYLKITNIGEIEVNSFKLIGASTKRNESDKIGFFGSGLKYAMSFLLRENIQFKIFSGKKEIVVSTREESHREQKFNLIQINGEDTSMTTDMGPKWSHWGAIREIYCNAIDEGDESITLVDKSDIKAIKGSTIFYIEMNSDLADVIDNWDSYFSKDRNDVVYTSSDLKSPVKIMWSRSNHEFLVYRKGIQCYKDLDRSCFHYDLPWVSINESREIDNTYMFKMKLTSFFEKEAPANVLKIMLEYMDKGLADFEYNLHWNQVCKPSAEWELAIGNRTIVYSDFAGWFKDEIEQDRSKFLLLPGTMVKFIQQYLPNVTVLGNNTGDHKYVEVPVTDKQKFLLSEIKRFFDETKYTLVSEIIIVSFANTYTLGCAFNNMILVSEKVFEQGRRKLAEVIYEENEHIKTNFADETRAFQNHLISQVISKMEEHHAFFL